MRDRGCIKEEEVTWVGRAEILAEAALRKHRDDTDGWGRRLGRSQGTRMAGFRATLIPSPTGVTTMPSENEGQSTFSQWRACRGKAGLLPSVIVCLPSDTRGLHLVRARTCFPLNMDVYPPEDFVPISEA